MEPIQSTLKRWMDNNEDFQQRLSLMKQEVLQDPYIARFLEKHPEISNEEVEKRLNKLYEFKTQSKQCENCQSFHSCKNILKGYSPILSMTNNEIHVSYEKCNNRLEHERSQHDKELIQSLYMPQEILRARFEEIDYDDKHRIVAIREASKFLDEAKHQLPQRGIFLTGPFGVGKTYFLGAIANKLQEYNISSMLIYMPEFVREIHGAIKDNTVQEKINAFKSADVLMFDDIGAENQSAWFRDEVLGSILQYRMMENLPVFFTSNYTMKQLENILSESTRGGVETVKSGRIMERIRQVSKEVSMFGDNRRN